MIPRPTTTDDMDYWASLNPLPVTYVAGRSDTTPCPAIITTTDDPHGVDGRTVVRVPWQLSEIELTHLAHGGTLWLSTWGGLPAHSLDVQAPT